MGSIHLERIAVKRNRGQFGCAVKAKWFGGKDRSLDCGLWSGYTVGRIRKISNLMGWA